MVTVAVAVAPPGLGAALVGAASERLRHQLFQAALEEQLRSAPDELPQRVAGEPGLEIVGQRLLHLKARWYVAV